MKMKKGIIIQGSSASHGETRKLVDYICDKLNMDMVDLLTKEIGIIDYQFKNQDDDFIPLSDSLTSKYDLLIFATPVYWYSMSATLKIFFDRISDTLKIKKDLGRRLRNMHMAVISSGSDHMLQPGFHMPFKASANYLGMSYVGDVHGWVEDDMKISPEVRLKLDQFCQNIKAFLSAN